jgi:hypothetical protein
MLEESLGEIFFGIVEYITEGLYGALTAADVAKPRLLLFLYDVEHIPGQISTVMTVPFFRGFEGDRHR